MLSCAVPNACKKIEILNRLSNLNSREYMETIMSLPEIPPKLEAYEVQHQLLGGHNQILYTTYK